MPGCILTCLRIEQKKLENLQKHLSEFGLVPRTHGNKGKKPKRALTFPVVKNVVKFIQQHAEVFGLSNSAPLRGRDCMPPVFLPASQTYKEMHRLHLQACEEMPIRAVC